MKLKHIYLLMSAGPLTSGPWPTYSSLEALAADVENYFTGTTAAIRVARRKAKRFPVEVKGYIIHKLTVKGMGDIKKEFAKLIEDSK